MIFSELYGSYYNAVAEILRETVKQPVTRKRIREIAADHAFSESAQAIESALVNERWKLIRADGSTLLKHSPSMPVTTLQKRWLKAISLDPRIRLFDCEFPDLDDVEPLFTQDDYRIFDQYSDGDDFSDPDYIRNFRLVLDAIRNERLLRFTVLNRRGSTTILRAVPKHLEYSDKDNKFRILTGDDRRRITINLGRIVSCEPALEKTPAWRSGIKSVDRMVVFELRDERNALDRIMMHFSHFVKEAEKIGEDLYRVSVRYDLQDETELVIRILSFGSHIRVIEPEHFVELIRNRLKAQMSRGL